VYLLDTNHCSQLLSGHPGLRRRIDELDGTPIATSTITVGELFYMAFRSERQGPNLREIEAFLADLPVYTIDNAVARMYGQVRTVAFAAFGPKERAKQRHTTIPQLGFDDNDLWIAVIALQHRLIVATGDSDFGRIAEVTPLQHENWLTPEATMR
jgi:tRNA(fMet)-specific endonuclease VapC